MRRGLRFRLALTHSFVALLAIAAIGITSWRALVAAGAGAATYYAVYNALFFVVHGNQWSLSSFNSEDLISSWMNQRMIEAIIAGLAGDDHNFVS